MSPLSCPFLESQPQDGPYLPNPHSTPNRPPAQDEFARVTKAYPALASTGCTAQFCQSGRMKHTDEERVGRNQPIDCVKRDAVDFLYQLRQAGILKTEKALNTRIHEVLDEVQTNSTTTRYSACDGTGSNMVQVPSVGVVGGNWTQTTEELEFGIRVAWKHARKCIMRSEYKDLKLCDLRHVRNSSEMATELVANLKVAFNNGEIRPTVFVFPPRGPNERGPMIWNSQLLSFAGYTEEDGTILGDPQNIDLTKAITELGWCPPTTRTKWDLLPLVTMAQGEEPVITELPRDAFPLVSIQHPKHKLAFEKLGLRWVPAPALSRLGFTIGGVQYTATPFIGWFMDAEIGVRNLADSFRYNVLPAVVKQMGLFAGDLEDLPDFERLALLSRAQLELNYAVSWSFAEAGVRMIDSLGASELFSRFDDEHLAENGFRLPSDPYWLAPPQGSIIPLWHRGAAPNYQPKPMICHHVQDPIKAWRREEGRQRLQISQGTKLAIRLAISPAASTRRIFVSYCSSGTVASKLCKKLQVLLCNAALGNPNIGHIMPARTLNALKKANWAENDVLVIVASNTRRGEMPQNGKDFVAAVKEQRLSNAVHFAIFGNGSKDYADTYNQTAKDLEALLRASGASSMIESALADSAAESPPWNAFSQFCDRLIATLSTKEDEGQAITIPHRPSYSPTPTQTLLDTKSWFRANVSAVIDGAAKNSMKRVVLDIGGRTYPTMSYLSILPPNAESVVQTLLRHMNTKPDERLHFAGGLTAEEFFRFYADLQQPFKNICWVTDIAPLGLFDLDEFKTLSVADAVSKLPPTWRYWASLEDLCRAVSRIQPRKYSIASDQFCNTDASGKDDSLELLVQHHAGGKFSDLCLRTMQISSIVTCRIERASHLERVATVTDRPLIIFATGSGIAPVRCVLQHRAMLTRSYSPLDDKIERKHAPISLFAGFKAEDKSHINEALEEAKKLGLFDILKLTPSNPKKKRAQDSVFDARVRKSLVSKIKGNAHVFVCAKPEAEEDFLVNLGALLGRNAREALGERYMADIYQPAV